MTIVLRSISEISSCFLGPRPWHIEIRHRVKRISTMNLFGFETLKLKIRRLKLWKPTVDYVRNASLLNLWGWGLVWGGPSGGRTSPAAAEAPWFPRCSYYYHTSMYNASLSLSLSFSLSLYIYIYTYTYTYIQYYSYSISPSPLTFPGLGSGVRSQCPFERAGTPGLHHKILHNKIFARVWVAQEPICFIGSG